MRAFRDEPTGAFTYLLADEACGRAAVVDPVLDYRPATRDVLTASADRLLGALRKTGLQLDYVLETHLHADHLTAAAYIRSVTGAQVVAGRALGTGRGFDRLVGDGETLMLGAETIEVLATPGHTACSLSYRVGDMVFVGDTLLMPDVGTGRADFPGADAHELYRSIRAVLRLPPSTRVFVGHDYPVPPRGHPRFETTVGEQAACNVLARKGVGEAEFVAARTRRDEGLPPPALLDIAVPVNRRAGSWPPLTPAW